MDAVPITIIHVNIAVILSLTTARDRSCCKLTALFGGGHVDNFFGPHSPPLRVKVKVLVQPDSLIIN